MSDNKMPLPSVTLKEPFVYDYPTREAYKTLRTNIMFCSSDKKVLAFTSCIPDEGKSTVTMGLARALAEVGKKVLLIDADMRRSTLFARYGERGRCAGLSQVLSGQTPVNEAIFATQYTGFHIMFCGYYPPNPVELLDSEDFRRLVAAAREAYDYVLIDTPPAGSIIDSVVVAKCCDGVIMVVANGKNTSRFARTCKQQIERAGCPIVGAILNMTNRRNEKYYNNSKYYRYGRGYGYGYGNEKRKINK